MILDVRTFSLSSCLVDSSSSSFEPPLQTFIEVDHIVKDPFTRIMSKIILQNGLLPNWLHKCCCPYLIATKQRVIYLCKTSTQYFSLTKPNCFKTASPEFAF